MEVYVQYNAIMPCDDLSEAKVSNNGYILSNNQSVKFCEYIF